MYGNKIAFRVKTSYKHDLRLNGSMCNDRLITIMNIRLLPHRLKVNRVYYSRCDSAFTSTRKFWRRIIEATLACLALPFSMPYIMLRDSGCTDKVYYYKITLAPTGLYK